MEIQQSYILIQLTVCIALFRLLSRVMVSGAGVVPKSTKDLEGMYGKGGKKTGKEGVDGGLLAGGGGENEEEPLLI